MERYRLIKEAEYLKMFSEEESNVDKQTEEQRGKDLDARMNALLDKNFDSEEAKARAIQAEMQNFIAFKKKAKIDSDDDSTDLYKSSSKRATSTPLPTPKRVSFDLGVEENEFATPHGSELDLSTPKPTTSKTDRKKTQPSSSYQSEAAEAYPPSPRKPGLAAVVRASPGVIPALRGKLNRDQQVVESNTIYKTRTRKKNQEGGRRKKHKKNMIGGWLSWS